MSLTSKRHGRYPVRHSEESLPGRFWTGLGPKSKVNGPKTGPKLPRPQAATTTTSTTTTTTTTTTNITTTTTAPSTTITKSLPASSHT